MTMPGEDETRDDALTAFPFKVEIQGYGTVTPPAATEQEESDNG